MDKINIIRTRITNLLKTVRKNESPGYDFKWKFDDGSITHYKILNAKSPEQYEDEILSLAVWLWSFKDYLQEEFKKDGRNPQAIEDFVNKREELQLCADIANFSKHAALSPNRTRSKDFSHLSRACMTIQGKNIAELVFEGQTITTKPQKPGEITYRIDAYNRSGNIINDVESIILQGLEAWEEFLRATK